MSWTTLSNKRVKVKKEHMCHGCTVKYPVGTTMNKNVSVDGGDFSSTYWCQICEEYMSDKWNDCDDGVGEGDCWEYDDYEQYREQKVKEGHPEGIWPEYLMKWKGKTITSS